MPSRTQAKNTASSFEWIGNGTEDDGKVVYSEFKFNENLIQSGDDVIINANDKDEYFVGHVDRLYECKGTKDPNRAIIHWYFTCKELKKCSGKINSVIAEPSRELFLPCLDSVKDSIADIDAETISRKCTVLKLKPQDLPPNCSNSDTQPSLFYVRYKFDEHFNLHPVNKRIARESASKRGCDLSGGVSNTTTPERNRRGTPRRLSTMKQNYVIENGVNSTARTPQVKKTPARTKIVDDSSVNRKSKTPAKVNNKMVNNKCIVPVEPLVFNSDCVSPSHGKRRASRSIPDESSVTPKRSKSGSQGAKRTKEPVTSLRPRFGTAEVLEQVFEEDEEKDVSDNDSVFDPSDGSDSSDDDDNDDDKDYDDDDFCETAAKSRTRG